MLVHAQPVVVIAIELVRAGERDANVHRAHSLDCHELECLALVDFGRFGYLAIRFVLVAVVHNSIKYYNKDRIVTYLI